MCRRGAATAVYAELAGVLSGFLSWDQQTLVMLQACGIEQAE
jgi:hypothetical protein